MQSSASRVSSLAWKGALVLAIAAGGLWTATHGVAGVAWKDVLTVLRGVALSQLVLLAAIWLGGLGIYSIVLSAALPGLGVRRSLLLNLSGSAVANVVPLGGAVATAVNWRMVRTWGHSNISFITFCVLTNALDVTTKLVLPLVAVATFVALSLHVPTVLWVVASACAGVLVLALGVQAVVLRPGREGRHMASSRSAVALARLRESGRLVRDLLGVHWARLLPGSAGYIAAQVALMYFSLRAVGLDVPVSVVLMAAAIERLGTLVPLTPGGTGVAEIGTVAWLVFSGLDPVLVVAGVLLYRVFLIAMEIPVGAVLLGGWAWLQRLPAARPVPRVTA
ncbi:MAG: lysylphosphatidylglycerol synthase domain-containing protein [Nocardioidaceae bacterium]